MDNERLKEYRRNYYAAHKTEINRKRREKYQDQRKKNRMDEHPDEQHKKTEDTNVTGCRYDRLQKKLVANKWSQEESSNFVNQMISSSSSASTFRISGCLESFSDHMSTVRTEDSTNDSQIGVVGYKFGTHYNDIDCTQRHSPSHVIARCVNSNEDFIVNVNSTQNIPPPINNNFLSGNDTHVEVSNRNMEGASNGVVRRDERTLVLPKVPACRHCGAYKFYKESVLFCCSGGEVILAETVLPEYLVHLITGTDRKSKDFQNQIRTYNNTFAFTSIGMHCDEAYQRRDHGIYTVKVQGQVYHFLDDLVPQDVTKKMSGIQFYFFDTEHQTENRMSALPRLDPIIVRSLVALLEPNPYSQFLKQASMLNNIEQYCIIIRSDPGLDQRRYNKPTSSEVAGIWIEDEVDATNNMNARDIRVYTKSGRSHIVQYYYRCYDPLQYVLMFPNGEPGWHSNIGRVGCKIRKKGIGSSKNLSDCPTFEAILDLEQSGVSRTRFNDTTVNIDNSSDEMRTHRRTTVSCREYYVYKMQHRMNDRSYLLRFGRLLQQYVVDNYIKIESMRLAYLKLNQKKMRQEHYQGILDSVISGIPVGGKVGTRVYLPTTFIGGPRDMRQRYLDSMALVQEFGRPDLFLTMTCNPNWPEIKELL